MMDRKEFGKELQRRTRKFAVRIIRLSSALPNTLVIPVPSFGIFSIPIDNKVRGPA